MAILRSYADVKKLKPTGAEQKLIDACKAGQQCVLGDGTRPDGPDPARTIRADILRYLILGGCEDCVVDGQGVWLIGGYIKGKLDLNFDTAKGATQLQNCHFERQFDSVQTRFQLVNLSGSHLPGWSTHSAKFEAHVFLDNITATGTIDLNTATIGGQLACEGARITAKGAFALVASGAKISGGVFLHPRVKKLQDEVTTPFHATGELRFNGATLGGFYAEQTTLVATSSGQSLSIGGATVNGAVKLSGCKSTGEILLAGSRITGRVTCERISLRNDHGHAFNGQAMKVEQALIWKKVEHGAGAVSLNGAHVAELDDDPANWPGPDALFLDGFTYDRIRGKVSTSPARMGWLKDGSYFGEEFRPQPFSQYARFLRAVGHDEEAREVLSTRERLRRASARKQLKASGHSGAGPLNLWSRFWDVLLRWVVGYGHHPFRSVWWLALLICATILPAHYAWEEGSFAPNSAPVLVSSQWRDITASETHPAAVWAGERLPDGETVMSLDEWKAKAPGRDWETFNRYAYGFDVVIPIINFGQTEAWAPSTTRGWWGWHLWWARWVLTVLGWIVTALGAAAITGIIRRD